VLEAAAHTVQAEPKGAEGAAECAALLPLPGLRLDHGTRMICAGRLLRLLTADTATATDWRIRSTTTTTSRLVDVQEVAAGAEGTHPEGAEGAAGDVLAAPTAGGPLLGGTVDEQTAGAIVAVACGVVAAAQLGLVLGVAVGNVQLVEAVGKLAALGVLAEA